MKEDSRLEPETRKLAEMGYYEILHEHINKMYKEAEDIMKGNNTNGRIPSFVLIYNGFILPTCRELRAANPEDPTAKELDEEWDKINSKYSNQRFSLTGTFKSTEELNERFRIISAFLNAIGVTRIKERRAEWRDERILLRLHELK